MLCVSQSVFDIGFSNNIAMASSIKFHFKGLMAPVFTSFNDDKDQSVNTEIIDQYASYLSESGIKGVLVNGTTGEGPVLSLIERKTVTEVWKKACTKYNLTLMVQIGGASLTDVIELAKHSAALKVNAILCLPELYFKPKTITDLVNYLKRIAQNCSEIPFLYYHIPWFTQLSLHMPTFCDQAEREIPNFVGIKYTSGDLEQGSDCLKPNRSVFLGADTILSAALVLGFDSAIMTSLNICPELAIEIMKSIDENRLHDAQLAQKKLTIAVKEILKNGDGEWVPSMKKAFNAQTKLNAGSVRQIC